MPWREVSAMEQRREFVRLAMMEGANRRELCRRFEISPDIGYKWLDRSKAGDGALADRSRRPHSSPGRSAPELEAAVLAVRDAHPAWGARKIGAWLERRSVEPPAVSTIHAILRRHGRIDPFPTAPGKAWTRFEKAEPNQLWQMDFKGWFRLSSGQPCHPLTIVDDHSRLSPCLKACADQQGQTVLPHLEATFRRYGLPLAFFVDNGPPWGEPSGEHWTRLEVWLLKLGVSVLHSRPYHPQSRGKIERFHRSLAAEVLDLERFDSFTQVQRAFDRWREVYNFERPHEALKLDCPAERYRPSPRTMPDSLPQPQYDSGEILRTVSTTKAYVRFKGRLWRVPKAFRGERLALRPLTRDGHYGVFFASHQVATIDLTDPKPVSHVSEQVSAMSPD
ncbi:IS481 family transposase [Caulobacter sp. BE254]|uniref:IS481 family transposase n=1 Tax=Caulobacter sp. BE254 TaxID=2817720 RepID=UPI002862C216|nr:IS481 family transposase [Caulobacter sp. BE254]MDR7119084.1 transposase InsO family protein [Caulobacter sp. BE254]